MQQVVRLWLAPDMADSDKRSRVLPRYSRQKPVVVEDTEHMWKAVDRRAYNVGLAEDTELSANDTMLRPLAAADGSNESAGCTSQLSQELEEW